MSKLQCIKEKTAPILCRISNSSSTSSDSRIAEDITDPKLLSLLEEVNSTQKIIILEDEIFGCLLCVKLPELVCRYKYMPMCQTNVY
mmetsp:Transcript_21924/g.19468  ORF Transcript_21924/g.19468 Transcript_21924/m.19468 type:complete len:87 (+) Transcript_21924:658-918(+)